MRIEARAAELAARRGGAGHDRRLLTARVATAAACVTGCGGGGSPADRAENGAIEPTSSRNEQVRVVRQTGPYRFVGAPIVVWWVGNGGPPPAYEVYFRLNRRLPDLKPAVQIRLDGLRAPSFPNGLGYEHDRPRRRCCAKGVNSFSSYLRSLFSGVPGQVVTVDIRVPGNRSSRMVARVPLRRMRRDDPAPGTATDAWFDVLGCLT